MRSTLKLLALVGASLLALEPTLATVTVKDASGSNVTLDNATAAKQDAIIAALGSLVTAASDPTPSNITVVPGANVATGQVTIGTSSTLLVASRALRKKLTFIVGASNVCAFGNTGVTTSTGFPLPATAGAGMTIDTTAAIYAACASSTTVSYIETY